MTSATGEVAAVPPTFAAWCNLMFAIILMNSGNLLLDRVSKDAGMSIALFFSPLFVVAIGCLGSAFLFYVRSLAQLPLAVAYPVLVGISMIVVAIANYGWIGTPLGPVQLLGVLVLFLGVVVISSTSRPS